MQIMLSTKVVSSARFSPMGPEWKTTSSFSVQKLKAQINVGSTAYALLPDSYINFLHFHDKSCNWTIFKTFQDWAAQVQCPCWWDGQECLVEAVWGDLNLSPWERQDFGGYCKLTRLPGWPAHIWWHPREITVIYLLGISSKATPLLPPSSTCLMHLIQFCYTTHIIRRRGDSKHMQVLVCLYLSHCPIHQKAQCPTENVCKTTLPNPTALPLTSCLSNEQFHSGHNVLYIDNNSTSLSYLQYLS